MYSEFLKTPRALLIAPAGHGKTHAIAECVKACPDGQKQLVLTHTHAGIASLKRKFHDLKIESSKYEVQTLTGFAQRIVAAFYGLSKLSYKQNDNKYFTEISQRCLSLISTSSLQSVLKISYQGLFVDEYQDCNISQHQIVLKLSEVMPTRILGDPLQQIFDFVDTPVNFDKDLNDFTRFELLDKPWRWMVDGNCEELGKKISTIRTQLLTNRIHFFLREDNSANYHIRKMSLDMVHLTNLQSFFSQLKGDSILIIVPMYKDMRTNSFQGSISDRAQLRLRLGLNHLGYSLLEAIDDKDFYKVSVKCDELIKHIQQRTNRYSEIEHLLLDLCLNKTAINEWLQNNRIVNKRGENKDLSSKLQCLCDDFITEASIEKLKAIIDFFCGDLKFKSKRPELLSSIRTCLKNSMENQCSVYDNMCLLKNKIRMNGRRVEGRYIGTTLLTKGLEFKTVVILGANNFEDKRNFYVAVSRACKELYLISDSNEIKLAK